MAQQTINIGAAPDDGTGDPLRTAFDKVNDNFTELYAEDAALGTAVADLDTRVDALEASGGVTTLDGLSDVDTTGKAVGDLLRWDGSGWVEYTPTKPYDRSLYFGAAVMSDAQALYRSKVNRAFTIPANLAGSNFEAATAATGSTALTIKKNGVAIATITFAAAGTVGAVSGTSGVDVAFAEDDVLSVDGPATADATLAGVSFDIKAFRS